MTAIDREPSGRGDMSGISRTSTHCVRLAAALLCLLLPAACAQPLAVEPVQLYADTAKQTRDAGGVILDRVAPIVAAQDGAPAAGNCGPDPQSGIPRCLDLGKIAAVGPRRADPPPVAVQRTALDLVAAYARILADLAEGKSAAELQTQVGATAAIAGTLVTLTGVGAPIGVAVAALAPQIQALAGRLEAARAGQLVRQSIAADKDTLQAVLRALEDTTPSMYELYKAKRQLDRLSALEARDRAAANAAVEDIKNFHAALGAYVLLLRQTSATLDTLASEAQQPVKLTPQTVQAALRKAIDARAEAQVLLNTVRQLEVARP